MCIRDSLNGTCWCRPGFGGLDCAVRTCPGDCGGNGYCNNGGCLCYAEYGGADCTVHAESKHIPIKCALDCVHSCLGKCNHVYSHDGFGPSRACYVDCTRTCLPGCAGGAAVGADGAFDIAALADPATGGKAAAALVAQSAAPALSHELLTTSLPRAAKAA